MYKDVRYTALGYLDILLHVIISMWLPKYVTLLNEVILELNSLTLKVVQTKAILFLKSMSERVGSDIERL